MFSYTKPIEALVYLCLNLCVWCVCVVEKRVKHFLRDVADQWRSLAVEVRSVRSMLEEVQGNWEKYSSCVASLQAWLEDAEAALRQPENTKRVSYTTHCVYEEWRCCIFSCSLTHLFVFSLLKLIQENMIACHFIKQPQSVNSSVPMMPEVYKCIVLASCCHRNDNVFERVH